MLTITMRQRDFCDDQGCFIDRVDAEGDCPCGRHLILSDPWENDCPCGRLYNGAGQELRPKSQWVDESYDGTPWDPEPGVGPGGGMLWS